MIRFLWLMFHSQESLASSNLGFAGQEAGRSLVMSLQEKLMSLSLGAEEQIVEPRLAIDFLWKLTTGMLNLPEKLTNLSPVAEEPGVEPLLAIDFLWKLMTGLLNLDLVAEQAVGRRLVMNFPGKSMNLSLDAEEPGVEPELVIGSLRRVMRDLLSPDLVAGQAAGRRLVIESLWRVRMG